MAWPRPPLAPVISMTRKLMPDVARGPAGGQMRNAGVGAHKPRSDRLLIGTDQADIGRRESPARHRIARRHALPGGGGHQSFTQDSLGA